MNDRSARFDSRGSSRQRYRAFVQDYKRGRLDDRTEAGEEQKPSTDTDTVSRSDNLPKTLPGQKDRGKRREYLREYLRWLWPHRYAVAVLMAFAVVAAGLEMISPLFMRF